jgi:hypothetical protein
MVYYLGLWHPAQRQVWDGPTCMSAEGPVIGPTTSPGAADRETYILTSHVCDFSDLEVPYMLTKSPKLLRKVGASVESAGEGVLVSRIGGQTGSAGRAS